MALFYITETKLVPYFEFHGCSYAKKNGLVEIEQPADGWDSSIRSILLLNFKNRDITHVYNVILTEILQMQPVSQTYTNVNDTYIPFSMLIKQMETRCLVTIESNKVKILVRGAPYLRLIHLILEKLEEENRVYTLEPVEVCQKEWYEEYICKVYLTQVRKYTCNEEIIPKFKQILEYVNYTVTELQENKFYTVYIPCYKKAPSIDLVVADAIFAYYLLKPDIY